MTNPGASRYLRGALFVLVPAAYLSMMFWRPASSYGPTGREGISPLLAVFMASVFLVSLISWNRHRLIALLGLVACYLWLVAVMLPVL